MHVNNTQIFHSGNKGAPALVLLLLCLPPPISTFCLPLVLLILQRPVLSLKMKMHDTNSFASLQLLLGLCNFWVFLIISLHHSCVSFSPIKIKDHIPLIFQKYCKGKDFILQFQVNNIYIYICFFVFNVSLTVRKLKKNWLPRHYC